MSIRPCIFQNKLYQLNPHLNYQLKDFAVEYLKYPKQNPTKLQTCIVPATGNDLKTIHAFYQIVDINKYQNIVYIAETQYKQTYQSPFKYWQSPVDPMLKIEIQQLDSIELARPDMCLAQHQMELHTIFMDPTLIRCNIYLFYVGLDQESQFLLQFNKDDTLFILLCNPLCLGLKYNTLPKFKSFDTYVISFFNELVSVLSHTDQHKYKQLIKKYSLHDVIALTFAFKLGLAYKFKFQYMVHKKVEQHSIGTNNYQFGDIIGASDMQNDEQQAAENDFELISLD